MITNLIKVIFCLNENKIKKITKKLTKTKREIKQYKRTQMSSTIYYCCYSFRFSSFSPRPSSVKLALTFFAPKLLVRDEVGRELVVARSALLTARRGADHLGDVVRVQLEEIPLVQIIGIGEISSQLHLVKVA